MARPRPSMLVVSESTSVSSSSSSPERAVYDDTDFFTAQRNDSQSSLGVASLGDMTMSSSLADERRISPISRLPPELLIYSFSKLGSSADLRNCILNLLNVVSSVRKEDGYYPYFALVKRLNLSNLSDQISDGTVQPFVHCKRIERLTLTGCTKLTDHGVVSLVTGSNSLLALDITGLEAVTDYTLNAVAEHCHRLQGLNITDCSKVTDRSLSSMAKNCRYLKR
ncbi:MAG: hypothetical protein Q9214_006433, partial [Letrouitia sp. 1 TL-2023]